MPVAIPYVGQFLTSCGDSDATSSNSLQIVERPKQSPLRFCLHIEQVGFLVAVSFGEKTGSSFCLTTGTEDAGGSWLFNEELTSCGLYSLTHDNGLGLLVVVVNCQTIGEMPLLCK